MRLYGRACAGNGRIGVAVLALACEAGHMIRSCTRRANQRVTPHHKTATATPYAIGNDIPLFSCNYNKKAHATQKVCTQSGWQAFTMVLIAAFAR